MMKQEVKESMGTEAFENTKRQMGYCGIWCGSCVIGNGTLRELTDRYEDVIRAYGLDHWGPEDFDFERFVKGLESIRQVSRCPGCLTGGGREHCELRACALDQGIAGCNECQDMALCKHTETLEHMRSGAVSAGLFVSIEDTDRERLIEEWASELKTKWPCCILF
jgi:hypothetical protein